MGDLRLWASLVNPDSDSDWLRQVKAPIKSRTGMICQNIKHVFDKKKVQQQNMASGQCPGNSAQFYGWSTFMYTKTAFKMEV